MDCVCCGCGKLIDGAEYLYLRSGHDSRYDVDRCYNCCVRLEYPEWFTDKLPFVASEKLSLSVVNEFALYKLFRLRVPLRMLLPRWRAKLKFIMNSSFGIECYYVWK